MKKERLSILLISLLVEAKCVNSSPHSDTVKDKPLKVSGLSHFKQIRRDEIGTGIINHLFLLLAKTNKKNVQNPRNQELHTTYITYG